MTSRAVVLPLAEQGVPVIWAETGGFRGNSYHGYELVLESLLKNFAAADGEKRRHHVNLRGIAPAFDVFWRGNLLGLRRLLARLGLTANTFFTVDDSVADIRQAGSAFLRAAGAALGLDPAAVEEAVAAENRRFYRLLEPLTPAFVVVLRLIEDLSGAIVAGR